MASLTKGCSVFIHVIDFTHPRLFCLALEGGILFMDLHLIYDGFQRYTGKIDKKEEENYFFIQQKFKSKVTPIDIKLQLIKLVRDLTRLNLRKVKIFEAKTNKK